MLFLLIKISVILFASVIFSRIIPRGVRAIMFPYVTGILILSYALNLFELDDNLTYFLQGVLPVLCTSFLIYLDPEKSVKIQKHEWYFLLFYFYFIIVTFFDQYTFYICVQKSLTLLNFLLVGWSIGRYAVLNNLFKKLILVLTWFSIPYFLALLMGTYESQSFEGEDRLGSIETLNSNLIGLIAVSLLTFPSLSLFTVKSSPIQKIVAFCALMLGGYVLVGSGSRNSFVAFLVGVLFISILFREARRLIFILTTIGTLIIGLRYSERIFQLRVFDFFESGTFENARGILYRNIFEDTTNKQWIFGGRSFIDFYFDEGRSFIWGNAHSIYAQILYEAGYIGIFLFIVYVTLHCYKAYSQKEYGRYALVMLAIVLFSGVSESYPLHAFSFSSLLWGISLGVLNALPRPNMSRLEILPKRRPDTFIDQSVHEKMAAQ